MLNHPEISRLRLECPCRRSFRGDSSFLDEKYSRSTAGRNSGLMIKDQSHGNRSMIVIRWLKMEPLSPSLSIG